MKDNTTTTLALGFTGWSNIEVPVGITFTTFLPRKVFLCWGSFRTNEGKYPREREREKGTLLKSLSLALSLYRVGIIHFTCIYVFIQIPYATIPVW